MEETKVNEVKEVKQKPKKELFAISFKTDNLMENRDIKEIMLGKVITRINKDTKEEKTEIGIYELRVNSQVSLNFYFKLLVENDFSESDFKRIEYQDLISKIGSKGTYIDKWLFRGDCLNIKDYVESNLGVK